MKVDKAPISEETKAAISKMLNEAEDKAAAITEAIEMITAETHKDLIDRILADAKRAEYDKEYKKSLGLRPLSEKETKFYSTLKMGAKAAVTANQIDIIPVETVDRTLEDIRSEYPIMQLISFAPANVKHWLTASKTGGSVWGALTDAISNSAELSAAISAMNIEVSKLYAFCVIPKAIRDLEIGYVDKYFRAVLAEAMYDGVVAGYLDGNGKTAPIGILRQIDTVGQDGTHTAKTVNQTLKGFGPKQLAPVLTTLSKNGKRAVTGLFLIANPTDVFQYVNPALYGDTISNGYVSKSFMPITVIQEPNMAAGKAAITMSGRYTMGFSGMQVEEYKETKAMDDADLLIAKIYGNGRADDDSSAYIFNPAKLEEYIPTVLTQTESGT